MNIEFIKINGKSDFDYLTDRWTSKMGDLPAEVAEQVILSEQWMNANGHSVQFMDDSLMPKLTEEHIKTFGKMADEILPLSDGEQLIEADTCKLIVLDEIYAEGTFVLYRKTNMAEMIYIFPELLVIEGIMYRDRMDNKEYEKVLSTIEDSKLWDNLPVVAVDTDSIEESGLLAEPITLAVIGSTILLGLITGVSSHVGSLALGWVLKSLGISNLVKEAQLSYDQLVSALETQSRQDFRKRVEVELNKFIIAQDNYNDMKTEDNLKMLELRAADLLGWASSDVQEVDRVEVLGFAQTLSLCVKQERAEFYREKDPDLLKAYYGVLIKSAKRELEKLQDLRNAFFNQRFDQIKGVKERKEGLLAWIFYYDDVNKPRDNWHRSSLLESSKRHASQIVLNRMNQRKNEVASKLNHALSGIDKLIQALHDITKIEVPPAAPRSN